MRILRQFTKLSSALVLLNLLSLTACMEEQEGDAQQEDARVTRHADMRFDRNNNGWARDGWTNNHSPNPHQFNIVCSPSPVRYGNCSERFEVRNTDCDPTDCPFQRNRSEISIEHDRVQARLNEDIWYGWSFYNETIINSGGSDKINFYLSQWKADNNAGPVIAFAAVRTDHAPRGDKTIAILLEDLGAHRSRAWHKANDFAYVCYLWDAEREKGRWVDIVLNTNFGTNDNGYLNVWINGEQRCSYKGLITITPLDFRSNGVQFRGPRNNHGIFNHGLRNWYENHPNEPVPTWVAYYDEFRVGSSREEVDIRLIEARNGEAVD